MFVASLLLCAWAQQGELYVGQKTSQQFNPASGHYDYRIAYEFYWLQPDGAVKYGLPSQSLPKSHFGQYRRSSTTIEMRWPHWSGFEKWASYEARPDSFTIGNVILRRVAREDNVKLQGIYSARQFVASSGASSERVLTFTQDGHVSAEEFHGVLNAAGTTSGTTRRNGRYQISAGRLHVQWTGGEKSDFDFFRYPGEESSLLFLDGQAFTRRR